MHKINSEQKSSLEAEAVKCIRCGACQVVCPVFQELGRESFTARGKNQILRALLDDRLHTTSEVESLFSCCLLCMACVKVCPAGVKTNRLVEAVRAQVINERGQKAIKKLTLDLGLRNRWIFNSVMAFLPGMQRLFFRRAPNGAGLLPRYTLGLDRRRLTHPVAKRSFRQSVPEMIRAQNSRGRVAFFTGCMGNFIYPETAAAAVQVLNANGYDVIVPRNQHCCGTPARVSGELSAAQKMARLNVDEFYSLLPRVEAVIVICASCGLALKSEIPFLLKDDPFYGPRAQALAKKTRDISEFITALPDWQEHIRARIKARVTYHDPCHLARGQGVTVPPREIIRAIPGVEFIELPRGQVCCGGAGTFSVFHYDLSMRITRRRLQDIETTGAQMVVTGCSACRMQLADGAYQAGLSLQFLHTVELLQMAYQTEKYNSNASYLAASIVS